VIGSTDSAPEDRTRSTCTSSSTSTTGEIIDEKADAVGDRAGTELAARPASNTRSPIGRPYPGLAT
jgi:hypothetical protein